MPRISSAPLWLRSGARCLSASSRALSSASASSGSGPSDPRSTRPDLPWRIARSNAPADTTPRRHRAASPIPRRPRCPWAARPGCVAAGRPDAGQRRVDDRQPCCRSPGAQRGEQVGRGGGAVPRGAGDPIAMLGVEPVVAGLCAQDGGRDCAVDETAQEIGAVRGPRHRPLLQHSVDRGSGRGRPFPGEVLHLVDLAGADPVRGGAAADQLERGHRPAGVHAHSQLGWRSHLNAADRAAEWHVHRKRCSERRSIAGRYAWSSVVGPVPG